MLCVCMNVCELTAPSMSHFKVLSLRASWHLLTPTIIMLICIVWLHKVIYAQFCSMAAQGCTLLLLNIWKKEHFMIIRVLSFSFFFDFFLFAFLNFVNLHPYFLTTQSVKALTKIWRPLPTENIIAEISNWAMLRCSWGDDELRSLFSQSSLTPYRKW